MSEHALSEELLDAMARQLAARKRRLLSGDSPLGWKVGFGAPAAMSKLGISEPLVG